MALAMPVWRAKQSARLAAVLNSPPLTWIAHSVALRKGMTPGSRRWTRAPRDRKSRAPSGRMFRPELMGRAPPRCPAHYRPRREGVKEGNRPPDSALQGRPQEPAVLLELLDDAGQEVDRVLVVLRLPQVAGLAQALQVGLDAVGQEPDVFQVAAGLRLVFRQARGLGRVADGAVDVGAQGDRPLRDLVVVVGQAHREGLEQRMQRREVRALDVPVGDLDLAVQVQAVRQPRVERLREALPRVFLEGTRTAIHGDLLHRPPLTPPGPRRRRGRPRRCAPRRARAPP